MIGSIFSLLIVIGFVWLIFRFLGLGYLIMSFFRYLKRMHEWEPLAFWFAVFSLITVPFVANPLYAVLTISFIVMLILAERKGIKLNLQRSVKRAIDSTRPVTPVTSVTPEGTLTDTPIEVPEDPRPTTVRIVGEFLRDDESQERERIKIVEVEKRLKARIKGQDHAIDAVVSTLKRAISGIRIKKESPLCVFLFVGATGTGKTQLVKEIAEALGRPLVRFDMPNYTSEAGVWELIGSPPGYVGSDKSGRLTGEIQANPVAVLLLDEIEKAHKKIWDPFLRVLDEGKMKDQSQGFTADFRNVIIFLTSNLLQFEDFIEDEAKLRNKILNSGYFRPEILNRIDRIIMFKQFDRQVMVEIVSDMLVRFVNTFAENNKLKVDIDIDRSLVEYVLENIDLKYGVRDAERFIEKVLGDALADWYLHHHLRKKDVTKMHIYTENNNIKIKEV